MAMNSERESAKIYTFPVKRRLGLDPRPQQARLAAEQHASLPRVDFGSGWYHEAAIQEASDPRKH